MGHVTLAWFSTALLFITISLFRKSGIVDTAWHTRFQTHQLLQDDSDDLAASSETKLWPFSNIPFTCGREDDLVFISWETYPWSLPVPPMRLHSSSTKVNLFYVKNLSKNLQCPICNLEFQFQLGSQYAVGCLNKEHILVCLTDQSYTCWNSGQSALCTLQEAEISVRAIHWSVLCCFL